MFCLESVRNVAETMGKLSSYLKVLELKSTLNSHSEFHNLLHQDRMLLQRGNKKNIKKIMVRY